MVEILCTKEISIHVPTRGTTVISANGVPYYDFNPRAHEGHDHVHEGRRRHTPISIHVPTRGTTSIS